jgi:electron transport complex protein RnfG
VKKFVDESWLVLVMGIVFAVLLAGTQTSLDAKIQANRKQALEEAIGDVTPGTVQMPEAKFDEKTTVFKCLDADGQQVGWAVRATGIGFVDKLTVVVGLDLAGEKVLGVKVIDDKETPGLGNKIRGEWILQYRGLDAARPATVTKNDPAEGANEIKAITGATYSSNYVTDILNRVTSEVRPRLSELTYE